MRAKLQPVSSCKLSTRIWFFKHVATLTLNAIYNAEKTQIYLRFWKCEKTYTILTHDWDKADLKLKFLQSFCAYIALSMLFIAYSFKTNKY